MKKDCVILSSWVPSSNRMEPYIRVLVSYYSDCDIYVGVNPSDYAELWIQKLKESGLNIIAEITPENLVIPQHASAVQTALKLYKEGAPFYISIFGVVFSAILIFFTLYFGYKTFKTFLDALFSDKSK